MPRAAVSLHSFHSPIPFWYTNNNFLISFLINFSPLNQHYVRTDIVDCTIVNVSTSMISLEFLFFFFLWLKAMRFFLCTVREAVCFCSFSLHSISWMSHVQTNGLFCLTMSLIDVQHQVLWIGVQFSNYSKIKSKKSSEIIQF